MKKLLSALTSVVITCTGLTVLSSTASNRYSGENCYYTEFTDFNQYFLKNTNKILYISSTKDKYGNYSYCSTETTYDSVFSTVYIYYNIYSQLSDEEAETLRGFLAENYSEMSLEPINETDSLTKLCDYEINYNAEIPLEKQLLLGIEIYKKTGLSFTQYYLDDIVFTQRLGDLDSDGTVNALDASNILTYYSDSQTGNTDTYTDEDIADITLLGDYDADGAVNALDASLVLKEYAETQTE